MSHTASEVSVFTPTNELRQVFGEPALVGSEKLEAYDTLFSLIASTIKPSDPIGWLLTKDVTDWEWELQRERVVKAEIIKHFQKEVVAELIKKLAPSGQMKGTLYRMFGADDDLTLWATDPEARARIDEELAAIGHSAPSILAQAYIRGAAQIDAIDRRIAAHERRRNAALKEEGYWNEGVRRKLQQAAAIIEGEFTDVAEKH